MPYPSYKDQKEGYRRKLEAIVELAGQWQSQLDGGGWPELTSLLDTFQQFAKDYSALLKLVPGEIVRPQFALNQGVDKLLNEWSGLSRACEQRIGSDPVTSPDSGLSGNLRGATRKLEGYCQRWLGSSVIYLKLTGPVVYFEKLYRLSRSVYAPQSPLISIPLTEYRPDYNFSNEDEDDELYWTALAHEFGHHIYWNGLSLGSAQKMRKAMLERVVEAIATAHPNVNSEEVQRTFERVELWGQWLEEVFADVCGTLLDGPAYALSTQEIAIERTNTDDDLIHGDDKHPAWYLRVFIALHTLRKMAEKSDSVDFQHTLQGDNGLISQLDQRWRTFCGDIGKNNYPDTVLTLIDLEDDIATVVDTILTDASYWPNTPKNLMDRLAYHGQKAMPSDLKKGFQFVVLDPLHENLDEETSKVPISPDDIEIPNTLEPLWMQLKSETDESSGAEPLLLWSLLLSLELGEIHFHANNHGRAKHWLFGRFHTHDVRTMRVIY